MLSVLITGATGFLGSHIAEQLSKNNINVIGLKRNTSDTWRCKSFEKKINWIDIDDCGKWKEKVIAIAPNIIVHSAWMGVGAKDRCDWSLQVKNIAFLTSLLEIGEKIEIAKFIFLGSQAEYGSVHEKVFENHLVNPLDAYASIKLACLQILSTFAKINDINWVWLRVFSVFGEREAENWLIPSVIKKMRDGHSMDVTLGQQKYAYLYAADFANILSAVITRKIESGIYNVSSNSTCELKQLLISLKEKVNPKFKLNFGAVPYRENQSMHIEGDMKKLTNQIGEFKFTDFNLAINNTLDYYLTK